MMRQTLLIAGLQTVLAGAAGARRQRIGAHSFNAGVRSLKCAIPAIRKRSAIHPATQPRGARWPG